MLGSSSNAPASWSAPVLWRFARREKRQRAAALQNLAEVHAALASVSIGVYPWFIFLRFRANHPISFYDFEMVLAANDYQAPFPAARRNFQPRMDTDEHGCKKRG